MITMKLNRAIMQLRHLNPELYRIVNYLWKNEIGKKNLFKFRFTLTYVIRYLEECLSLCEARFEQLSQGGGLSIPLGGDGSYLI